MPGIRIGAIPWVDSNGSLWLFGGEGYGASGYGDLNDLWKFDGTNWTWISGSNGINQVGIYGARGTAASNNVPGARRKAVSWSDSAGNLWLFGGLVSASCNSLNDLWKFDGTNWTWVSGSNVVNQSGIYGTKGNTASNNVPGSRSGAISWLDSTGNLWLFGGQGYRASDSGYLNDLWKFDGTNWTWVSGSNVINQFGTYGTKGTPAAGNVPGARGDAISWIDGTSNLWLFGGQGYGANDLWKVKP